MLTPFKIKLASKHSWKMKMSLESMDFNGNISEEEEQLKI